MKKIIVLGITLIVVGSGFLGIRWGVPNRNRTDLVLTPELKNENFFVKLARSRDEIYKKSDLNPPAFAWRAQQQGLSYDSVVNREIPPRSDNTVVLDSTKKMPLEITRAISSFLIRSINADEQDMLSSISKMKPENLDFDPKFYRYGGSYIYPLAGWFWFLSKIGVLKVTSELPYYYANPNEMGKFYIFGRILSHISGLLLIILVFLVAINLYDYNTAILSAVFSLTLPILLIEGNTMKPHIYGAFWATCCVYFAVKIYKYGDNKKYENLFGIVLGLASSAAINNYLYILLLPLAILLRDIYSKKLKDIIYVIIARTIRVFILSMIVFLITNPYIFVNFKSYWDELHWTASFHHFSFRPWKFFLIPLSSAMSMAMLILSGLSIIYVIVNKTRDDQFLLFFLIPILAFISIASGGQGELPPYMRYHIPLLLIMMILSARGIVCFVAKVRSPLRYFVWGTVFVVMVCALMLKAAYLVCYIRDNENNAESIKAGYWINENIPRGSTIGIMKYTPHTDCVPPFRFTNYRIISDFERVSDISKVIELPEYFIIGESPDFLEIRWKNFFDYYQRIKYFKYEIPFMPGFKNIFASANFPVAIYKKRYNLKMHRKYSD